MLGRVISSMKPRPAHRAATINIWGVKSHKEDPEHPKRNEPLDPLYGKDVYYNSEGLMGEYTDTVYHTEVLEHQENPYATLYTGFRAKWDVLKFIFYGLS